MALKLSRIDRPAGSKHRAMRSRIPGYRWLMVFVLLALLGVPQATARVQAASSGFDPQTGWIEPVKAVAAQADGKVLIGGALQVNGRIGIARLNTDGSVDDGFQASADGRVHTIAVQADGKILVGGSFQHMNGELRPGLARLNPDGTLDDPYLARVTGSVFSMVLQPEDGKLLIGGFFSKVNGQSTNHIARLNDDGSLDTDFDARSGTDSWIDTIALAGGQVLIGGNFRAVDGQARDHIARLNDDGSLDASFNPGANARVHSIAVQADGMILAGGEFTMIGGKERSKVARLSPTGTPDRTFVPPVNGTVYSLAVEQDGGVLIGGNFTMLLHGRIQHAIVRIEASGNYAYGFNPDPNDAVNAIVAQADGRILIGGVFTQVYGQPRNRIARLNADGTLDSRGLLDTSFQMGSWRDMSFRTIAIQADGKFLIGDQAIHRLNPDGSLDVTFAPPTANLSPDSIIAAFATQADGKILVGGRFWAPSGANLMRLNPDGSYDWSFHWSSTSSMVKSIVLQPDGKILVGGELYRGVVRLNADGTTDTSFRSAFTNNINTLALQGDGKIVVGYSSLLARLNPDGTLDQSFNPVDMRITNVRNVRLQPDGKLLVGGCYREASGQTINRLIRLQADGTLDSSFNSGLEPSTCWRTADMALQADGKLLVDTGNMAEDWSQRGLYRLNPDGSIDSSFDAKQQDYIFAISLQADGRILVNGPSTLTYEGRQYRMFRLFNTAAARQTLSVNPSGTAISWWRGGAAPEVDRVSFELSTDGVTYTPLGKGTYANGSWQLSGTTLPRNQNLFIRTRGFYSTGSAMFSATSSSIVEAVHNVSLPSDS